MNLDIVLSVTTIKSRICKLPKILSSIIKKNNLPYTIHIFYSSEPNIYDDGCNQCDLEELYVFARVLAQTNSNIQMKISQVENIGPYRKLIPALKIYKNHIIITIDDDEIFEDNLIDLFVEAYVKHNCIICSSSSIVDIKNYLNMSDTIDYYNKIFKTDTPYMNLLPQGYGGILYHSSMFDENFINFNYGELDQMLIKNDDAFIRFYTYNKNIPVFVLDICQSNIYNFDLNESLFKSNKNEKLNLIFQKIYLHQQKLNSTFEQDMNENNNKDHKYNYECDHNQDQINTTDIIKLLELYQLQKHQIQKYSVHTGTDVKKLQYKINFESSNKFIDLNKQIQDLFFNASRTKTNVLLINILSDELRYSSAMHEFKKLLVTDFIHLKATYWKEKEKFVNDMEYVINFIGKFNSNVSNKKLNLNDFSEFNDPNIIIQDGPLACYCSHVRSMIYGYLNFEHYTIVVEDDICIGDTSLITDCLKKIPNDWDIICFGAQPINKFYEGSFYKFTDLFHSTQFYLIRNSCMSTVFKNLYPINDQVDILLSKLHNVLNIYNIPNSVFQKNYETNTQNNLFVIYNSPNYEYMRISINKIKLLLCEILKKKYWNNLQDDTKKIFENNMRDVSLKILFDVIFDKISFDNNSDKFVRNNNLSLQNYNPHQHSQNNTTHNNITYNDYFLQNNTEKLKKEISIIINGCVKGINVDDYVSHIINDIYEIIDGFDVYALVSNLNPNLNPNLNSPIQIIPLNYGSTSNIMLACNEKSFDMERCVVIKHYNHNPRWKNLTCEHVSSKDICTKEIQILNLLKNSNHFAKIINTNANTNTSTNMIFLEYTGYTLFDNFTLVYDWEKQIGDIFDELDKRDIYYPEFNLKNITCKNGIMYFIDFGLARIEFDIEKNNININNKNVFIDLLQIISNKFKIITDVDIQHVFYNNLINNIKLTKNPKYINNIF